MSFRSDDEKNSDDDSFRRWCCQEEVDEKEALKKSDKGAESLNPIIVAWCSY